jgi:hypothetical protein
MRSTPMVLMMLGSLLLPPAAKAQHVVADIFVGGGPVSGRVIIGGPVYSPRYHGAPRYRAVYVYRVQHGPAWFRSRGYRAVRFWYDGDRDWYYDHVDGRQGRLREVVVYERGGRYYRGDEDHRDLGREGHRSARDRNDYIARTRLHELGEPR